MRRVEAEIEALRRQRLSSPAIAHQLGRPVATVGVVLRRRGLGRLSASTPSPRAIRYQREQPGELIHIDIKKLGRSMASVTGSPAIGAARSVASAGTSCMSASTMRRGSPTPRSCPTSARRVR